MNESLSILENGYSIGKDSKLLPCIVPLINFSFVYLKGFGHGVVDFSI